VWFGGKAAVEADARLLNYSKMFVLALANFTGIAMCYTTKNSDDN